MTQLPQETDASRDAGVYLLIYPTSEGVKYATFATKKEATAALEKLGPDLIPGVKLFKSAKEVEIRTKVTFTF